MIIDHYATRRVGMSFKQLSDDQLSTPQNFFIIERAIINLQVMRALLSVLLFLILIVPQNLLAQVSEVSLEELYDGGPEAPMILSTDMPLPDAWYKPQDATFHWGLPIEVTAAAADLYLESGREPMTSYRPPVASVTVSTDDLIEGAQYLTVQFKNEDKWGMYAERQILIDGTPPEPFSISIQKLEDGGNGVLASFVAVDRLSGIAYFEVNANGYQARVSPAEAAQGFFLPLQANTEVSLMVSAYDMAGNARTSSTLIHPITIEPSIAVLGLTGFAAEEPASILAALMAALLLIMFGYMVYERQRYAAAVTDLREESDEAQSQIIRVFNALRSEIYDQINAIDGKTRLSKNEKEAVSGLTKALKVSEKLLNKEVKDIRKLL